MTPIWNAGNALRQRLPISATWRLAAPAAGSDSSLRSAPGITWGYIRAPGRPLSRKPCPGTGRQAHARLPDRGTQVRLGTVLIHELKQLLPIRPRQRMFRPQEIENLKQRLPGLSVTPAGRFPNQTQQIIHGTG